MDNEETRRAFLQTAAFLSVISTGCGRHGGKGSGEQTNSTELGGSGQSDERVKPYVFGIYTADAASTVMRQILPLLDGLEASLGAEVQPQIFNYEDGIQAIAEGKVDFMRLGPASYVMVSRQNPEIQLLAMESKKGGRTFKGVIAVHDDLPSGTSLRPSGATCPKVY